MKRTIVAGPGWYAVTEDGVLMEFLQEGTDDESGMILLGRVGRLMPGLNCAFVDIGRKKYGFLPMNEESSSFTGGKPRSGETMLLQIKKEETGGKGAFLTRDITLPGRFVIIMPMNRYTGVSSRIRDEAIRERLKKTGSAIAEGRFGIVMRNASENADESTVREEAEKLYETWNEIVRLAAAGGRPGTQFRQDNPLTRLKADYTAGGYDMINETEGPGQEYIRQLNLAEQRRLKLPGGGNIVIDRCEAMTVIDVNTASSTGNGTKQQNVLETNLEACRLIAQQVRLRNLGGIILIDFIDMDKETDRSLVYNTLYDCFRQDRTKTVIHGWTKLGIIEMTRKRTSRELSVYRGTE